LEEKKEDRHSGGANPACVELDLGRGRRVVINWSEMSPEEEARFYTELKCIAGYLIRLERGQGNKEDVQRRTQSE
jgi:hypothetical protein